MWARADQLRRADIAVAAERARFGTVVDLRPVSLPPDGGRLHGATYGMKACLERPPAATALWPAAEEFLSLNGDRLEHHTRGFYLDRSGCEVRVREAIREARTAYHLSGGWAAT